MENGMTIVPNPAGLEKQCEFINSLIEHHRLTTIVFVNSCSYRLHNYSLLNTNRFHKTNEEVVGRIRSIH